jgi:quercetin dioxygenase-like cupin family protein
MLEKVRKPDEIASTQSEVARRHPLLRLVGRDDVESEPAIWHEAFQGVEFRTLASGPEMMLTLLRLQRGAAVPVHHHRAAQAGYVLEGCLRLTTADGQRTVPAGECYVIPPGLAHQVRAIEPTTVLDAFAPGFGHAPEAGLFADTAAARPAGLPRAPGRRPRRLNDSALEHQSVDSV